MPTSNTRDCFREFIGMRVKGVLFDALPVGRADLNGGSKTLVFQDGRGLTIASNGSYWIDGADEVARATGVVTGQLKKTQRELRGILDLAGEPGAGK